MTLFLRILYFFYLILRLVSRRIFLASAVIDSTDDDEIVLIFRQKTSETSIKTISLVYESSVITILKKYAYIIMTKG